MAGRRGARRRGPRGLPVFLVLGGAYSVLVPAWEVPDEFAHFRFVEHLVEARALPVLGQDVFGEEHQAPLYYALAALPASVADFSDKTGAFRWNREFSWEVGGDVNIAIAWEGTASGLRGHSLALRVVRSVSLLMALGTVLLAVSLARRMSPEGEWAALVAGALARRAQYS